MSRILRKRGPGGDDGGVHHGEAEGAATEHEAHTTPTAATTATATSSRTTRRSGTTPAAVAAASPVQPEARDSKRRRLEESKQEDEAGGQHHDADGKPAADVADGKPTAKAEGVADEEMKDHDHPSQSPSGPAPGSDAPLAPPAPPSMRRLKSLSKPNSNHHPNQNPRTAHAAAGLGPLADVFGGVLPSGSLSVGAPTFRKVVVGKISMTNSPDALQQQERQRQQRSGHDHTGVQEGNILHGRREKSVVFSYKEPTEASLRVTAASASAAAASSGASHSRSRRPTRGHAPPSEDESDHQGGRRVTPPLARGSATAGAQKITRAQARELGMSFEELQRVSGVEGETEEHNAAPTRRTSGRSHAAAAAAASSAAGPAGASESDSASDLHPRRSRSTTRTRRRIVEEEDEDEFSEPPADEEEDDASSEESASEVDNSYRNSRPRREATRIQSYDENKLIKEAHQKGRAAAHDASDEEETREGRVRGEAIQTSYFRDMKPSMVRLASGVEITDREYRAMQRRGENVRVLLPGEQPSDPIEIDAAGESGAGGGGAAGDVRRSTRARQQLRPYTAGQKEDRTDDEVVQPRYVRPSNAGRRAGGGANKGGGGGRRGAGGRSRRHRPARYGDSSSDGSSSSSSTTTDDSSDPGRTDRRRHRQSRNGIQPLHLQIQHAMRRMDAEAANAGVKGARAPPGGRKSKDGRLADIDPITVDESVDWQSIGGLDAHVNALKEMVVLPLLYPELFAKFQVQPPKGVLFFGPAGTGKTLVARALANTCSATGQKVSFFMRKGADVLNKWVGESEKQLRLLFEQARAMQPSIIFFDEIDGLAPVRSSRQDQIHASIVSTLLALMDGLDARGQVIVIGATNRVDSIDPALRRPGRFDRELVFSLPNKSARRAILDIHTRAWQPRPEAHFLHGIADLCVGYCGADLRALCTEATLRAVRRRYPQIYLSADKLAIDVQEIRVRQCDFLDAMRGIVPASHRANTVVARTIPKHLEPLLQPALDEILQRIQGIFPLGAVTKSAQAAGASQTHAMVEEDDDDDALMLDSALAPASTPDGPTLDLVASSFPLPSSNGSTVPTSALASSPPVPPSALRTMATRPQQPMPLRPRFLVHAAHAGAGQGHLGPAVLHHFEEFAVFSLDLPLLLGDPQAKNAEEACVRVLQECKRNAPSLLYWPHVDLWWTTAPESLRNTILMLLADLPPNAAIFLLATADGKQEELPEELRALFPLPAASTSSTQSAGAAASSSSSSSAFAHSSSLSYCIPPLTDSQLGEFVAPILAELKREIPRMRRIEVTAAAAEKLPVLQKVGTDPAAAGAAGSAVSELTPEEEVASESALTPTQLNLKVSHEDSLLRLLRMSLRGIVQTLIRTFPAFKYRPSLEDHPDYLDVVAQAMSLTDIESRVNTDRAYDSLMKFLNDVELLVSNCKEYSSHRNNEYRALVNKACHLQDSTLSMTSQLDLKLVHQCEAISKRRAIRTAKFRQETATTAAAAAKEPMRQTRSKGPTDGGGEATKAEPATAAEEDGVVRMEIDEEEDKSPVKTEGAATTPADAAVAAAAVAPSSAAATGERPIVSITGTPASGVADGAAAAAASPVGSPSPSDSLLLPASPPLSLDLAALASLTADAVRALRGLSVDAVEMVGFQLMKVVVSYQLRPNRNEAIAQIHRLLAEVTDQQRR